MPFKCYAMMQHYQGRTHQNCPDHILSAHFSISYPERGSAYLMGLELHPSVSPSTAGLAYPGGALAHAGRRPEPAPLLGEA